MKYPFESEWVPTVQPPEPDQVTVDQLVQRITGFTVPYQDALDILTQADAANVAASASASAAAASEGAAVGSETAAAASEGEAASYALSAASARDQAATAGRVYASTAAGIAAVADGEFFAVPAASPYDDWLILYQRSGASAVEKSRSIGAGSAFLAALLNHSWGLRDAAGELAVGLTPLGVLEIASADMREASADSATIGTVPHGELVDLVGYRWAISDGVGGVALGVRPDGTVEVGALEASVVGGARSNPTQAARDYGSEINHVISYGQSLSIGSQSVPARTTAQRHDSLRFVGGVRPADGGAAPGIYASLVSLVETSPSSSGETPVAGTLEAIHDAVLAEDGIAYDAHSFTLLGSACGVPSTPVSGLDKGSGPYATLLEHVTYGLARATALDKTYRVLAVTWSQGEQDTDDGTSAATYRSLLAQLITDLNADIKAITGQTDDIHLFGYQLSSWKVYAGATWEIALAQLAEANSNPLFHVVGPNYHLTHAADNVHLTNDSSKRLGSYYGKAIKRVVTDAGTWSVLQPVSSQVVGKAAVLKFTVPAGPLVLDTTNVAAATNYGFELVDSGGGALTISSVALLGDNRVKITAASTIPAGAKVRYAATGAGTTGPVNGPRGNLRDSAGDRGYYDPAGQVRLLHNWCVHFEWAL